MGDPQHAYPVIHITGTNGKGSTAQMITRLLMAQGLQRRHVHQPAPRAGQRAPRPQRRADQRRDFAEQIAAVADLEGLTGVRPSYFEACTAAAFRWFADIAVDVAVVEVGLLGRWDATNVVDAQVAVVTNIGMDHNEFAGPTLADIAREKAGIIKPASAVVIGETDPELVAVLSEPPAASRLLRGVDFETAGNQLGRRRPARRHPHADDDLPRGVRAAARRPPGRQRLDRADRGRGVLRRPARRRTSSTEGFAAVVDARPLRGARPPAAGDRRRRPQPAGRRHVRPGVLRRLRPDGPADPRRRHAARADGDARGAARRRVRRRRRLHRAVAARRRRSQDVATAAVALGCDEVLAADTVAEACALAMRSADGDDAILATGSLYVAGAARPALQSLTP